VTSSAKAQQAPFVLSEVEGRVQGDALLVRTSMRTEWWVDSAGGKAAVGRVR